jgi:hypothetical protein
MTIFIANLLVLRGYVADHLSSDIVVLSSGGKGLQAARLLASAHLVAKKEAVRSLARSRFRAAGPPSLSVEPVASQSHRDGRTPADRRRDKRHFNHE